MKGVPNDIIGTSYSSGTKGWIYKFVMPMCFRERRVLS